MAQQELLCLKSVSLKYRDTLAVKNLDLAVYPGEILGLLGPNGCGKSTTLNAIAGNHELDSGCILLDGQSHTQHPLSYRAQIGFVPQELAFYEELSPYANLRFFGNIYGIHGNDLSQRIAEVLNLVRLEDRAYTPAFGFSGGMKRRLNLACALIHKPKLLLLDEPTVGLDPPSREAVFSCLHKLRDEGCAIVYTTHYIIMKALAKKTNTTIPNYIYEEDYDSSLTDQSLLRKNQAEETHSLEQYLLELSEIKVA